MAGIEFVPATILQKLAVTEVDLRECSKSWGRKLISSHMCATSGEIGKGACVGDSGSPLNSVMDEKKDIWELAGVVSFGSKLCGNVDRPLGFTRISLGIGSWIRGVVGDELPSHL